MCRSSQCVTDICAMPSDTATPCDAPLCSSVISSAQPPAWRVPRPVSSGDKTSLRGKEHTSAVFLQHLGAGPRAGRTGCWVGGGRATEESLRDLLVLPHPSQATPFTGQSKAQAGWCFALLCFLQLTGIYYTLSILSVQCSGFSTKVPFQ